MRKKEVFLTGILSGIGVFTFGFGIMFLIWKLIGSPEGLPGFFHYRAATFGDGLALPILIGSGIIFVGINRELENQKKTPMCIVLALTGVFIGILIQATWLIRNDTVLNWSIPIPHYFNLAGWYHSLFFIAMFGIITYLFCKIWMILRYKQSAYLEIDKRLIAVFASALAFFLEMFFVDDYSSFFPIVILMTLVVIGLIFIFAVFIKSSSRRHMKELFSGIVFGIIGIYSISLYLCIPVKGNLIVAIGGGLCTCFLWRVEENSIRQLVSKDILLFLPYTLAIYVISGLTNWGEFLFGLIFLLVACVLLEKIYNREMRFRSASFVAFCIYLIIRKVPFESWVINKGREVLFALVILFLFKKEIISYFNVLVGAEVSKNNEKLNSSNFKEIKGKVYLQIVLGILAVILFMTRWLWEIAKQNEAEIAKGAVYFPGWIMWTLAFCILSLSFLSIIHRNDFYPRIFAVLVSGIAYMVLIWLIFINIQMLPVLNWTSIKIIMFSCSVFACLGSAGLVSYGYYANTVYLRGLSDKIITKIMSVVLFFGTGILNFFILVLVLYQQAWMTLLMVLTVLIIAYLVLPILCVLAFHYGRKQYHVVGDNALGSVAQDGLTICSLVVFVVCLPCLYISLIKITDFFDVLSGLILIGKVFLPVEFCLKNNVEHVERQKEVLLKYPEEKEVWERLHNRIRNQSYQTIFATFPYVVIAVILKIGEGILNSKNPDEIRKGLFQMYIDRKEE